MLTLSRLKQTPIYPKYKNVLKTSLKRPEYVFLWNSNKREELQGGKNQPGVLYALFQNIV
jgi:hypothetical protein